MFLKECTRCKESKLVSEFHKHATGKHGVNSKCRACISTIKRNKRLELLKDKEWVIKEKNRNRDKYYRSKQGFISNKYNKMKSKSKERGHDLPTFSKDEFSEWMYKNGFEELFKRWKSSGYHTDFSPSVDRLNEDRGYIFSNMRLVTWKENLNYSYHTRSLTKQNDKVIAVKLIK